MLDGGQEVAKSSEHEKDGSSKQTGSLWNCAQPLDQTHDTVDAGARVVGRDLADGGIERGRGWADPKEKRHLNKEDDEGRGQCKGAEEVHDYNNSKDVRNAQSEAQDHGQDSEPLSIDTEVSCSKFLLERHLGGRFGVVDEEDVGVFACFAPVM